MTSSKPVASGVEVNGLDIADTCDGVEQTAFEEWASSEKYDMHEHPMHYLFLDPKTNAARMGWKAGILHARNRIMSALPPKATALVVSEPVAWQVRREGNVEWSTVSARDVNGYSDRYERRPLYTSPQPQPQPKAVTEELDGADLQTLMQLKRDNVWDGARPVLENPIADEMRRAFALSERGLIALEQVARGVRLHITRKGVAALEAAMKEA